MAGKGRDRGKVREVVISKIEITKPTEKPTVDGRSLSLQQYHSKVNEMGRKVVKFVLELSPDNLLSVKMALMQAVEEVERRLKKNKEV